MNSFKIAHGIDTNGLSVVAFTRSAILMPTRLALMLRVTSSFVFCFLGLTLNCLAADMYWDTSSAPGLQGGNALAVGSFWSPDTGGTTLTTLASNDNVFIQADTTKSSQLQLNVGDKLYINDFTVDNSNIVDLGGVNASVFVKGTFTVQGASYISWNCSGVFQLNWNSTNDVLIQEGSTNVFNAGASQKIWSLGALTFGAGDNQLKYGGGIYGELDCTFTNISGGRSSAINLGIVDNSYLKINTAENSSFGGIISGAGQVIKAGTGSLTLSGSNTYSGGTKLSGGTLLLGDVNALGNGVFSNSATATLGTTTDLSGGDGVTNVMNLGAALTLNVMNNLQLSGVIRGGYNLIIKGGSTVTLSGSNTYSGTTIVSNGTLLVNGSYTGGGAYNVISGAILGGTGNVGSAIAITNGVTLAAGDKDGMGTLTVTNLTFGTNSTNLVRIAGTSTGQCSCIYTTNGIVSLGGNAVLVVDDSTYTGGGAGIEMLIIKVSGGGTISGQFAGMPEGFKINTPRGSLILSYSGGDGDDVSLKYLARGTVLTIR
jgi:autotransporter-associated beta strand protein